MRDLVLAPALALSPDVALTLAFGFAPALAFAFALAPPPALAPDRLMQIRAERAGMQSIGPKVFSLSIRKCLYN